MHSTYCVTCRRERTVDPAAVREWARSRGISVSSTGRLPTRLVAAYMEAQAVSVP
jgi:hypothetical protein